MFGLVESEILRRIRPAPLLDRLSEGDLGALTERTAEPLDLRDYAELALRGGYPEPVLRLPASERSVWFDSYVQQLLSRDLAEISPRSDSERLRSYLEANAIQSASATSSIPLSPLASCAWSCRASFATDTCWDECWTRS